MGGTAAPPSPAPAPTSPPPLTSTAVQPLRYPMAELNNEVIRRHPELGMHSTEDMTHEDMGHGRPRVSHRPTEDGALPGHLKKLKSRWGQLLRFYSQRVPLDFKF